MGAGASLHHCLNVILFLILKGKWLESKWYPQLECQNYVTEELGFQIDLKRDYLLKWDKQTKKALKTQK